MANISPGRALLFGNLIPGSPLANLGPLGKQDFLLDIPEPENPEKVISLVQGRLKDRRKFLISKVTDLREEQPAALLQIGASRSLAVCRIARYFARKDFQIFIDDLLEIIAEKSEIAENFNSVTKLKEIFLIPDKISDEIFATSKIKDEGEKIIKEIQKSLAENQGITNAHNSLEELKKILLVAEKKGFAECSLLRSEILLNSLKNLREDQLAELNPIAIGSGFLVGANKLLTNYHVLFDEEVANQCVAQFNYEEVGGAVPKTVDYELDPNMLFIHEPNLDYTLVQLKFNRLTRQAGYHFGWIQMVEDDSNIIPSLDEGEIQELASEGFELSQEEAEGDNVILIHHPKGREKKIDITNNRVIKGGLYKSFLRYTADSNYGSSGCPVFNTPIQV